MVVVVVVVVFFVVVLLVLVLVFMGCSCYLLAMIWPQAACARRYWPPVLHLRIFFFFADSLNKSPTGSTST